MKVYKSFAEIDQELKVLELKSEIEKEEMKFTTSQIKEDLSPISMIGSAANNVIKKALTLKRLADLVGLRKRRR